MWCNPANTLDQLYLTLLPTLHSTSASEYPIDSKILKKLINQSVGESNIRAVIGGITLLFLKNESVNLRKQFQVLHLCNMDRIFYLLSQRTMSNKLQNELYQLVNITVSRWFQSTPRQELEKLLACLKGELNFFEKALQYVNDEKGEKRYLSASMLKIFLSALQDQRTKGEKYCDKFQDHALYIYNNKKQLYLLNVIYQIEFLLLRNIHRQQEMYNPQHLIVYIQKKLFNFTINRRFSVLIESMAFLMRKLFIIKSNNHVPSNTYSQFLLRIQQVIDRFFSRIKLSQRIDFHSYHMKENNFFLYLQHIFEPNITAQYNIINQWKAALKEAMEKSLPTETREAAPDQIQEAIFYLQLRKRNGAQSKEGDEFPCIQQRIILRTIKNALLKAQGINLSLKVIQILQKTALNTIYDKCNIIQKGVIFYYIHYYENYTFHDEKQEQLSKKIKPKLIHIKNSLSNQYLLELIQFYLIQAQIGNLYSINPNDQRENQIIINIYEAFIDQLYTRILAYLDQYKKMDTTKQLYYLKTMSKYLLFIIHAICSEYDTPFICKNCKQVSENSLCNECEYICLGVRLNRGQTLINMCRDKYFYVEMICSLRQKSRQVYMRIGGDMQVSTVEWLYMFSYVLEGLIPI